MRSGHRKHSASDIMDLDTLSDEQLFQYINDIVVRERLFLDSNFDRQTIMDRFQLSKERVGASFSKGSQYVGALQETKMRGGDFIRELAHEEK